MSPANHGVSEDTELNSANDPRQVEVFALRKITGLLASAQNVPDNEEKILHAVRLNWRLWTIFQTSLLDANCPLPDTIRNNLLSLSNFVDKHSADIIAAPEPSKLDVLIRINHDLADGLSGAASPSPQP